LSHFRALHQRQKLFTAEIAEDTEKTNLGGEAHSLQAHSRHTGIKHSA